MLSCKKDAPSPPQQPKVRNVLLITIDTLRADALSVYGNKTRSPFFEKFAEQATIFNRAFTPAPITLPAHTSLLTGLNPPSHGVRNNGTFRAPQGLELLSEIARKQGLTTAAFIGAFPLAAQYGLNQGFDVYDDHFSTKTRETGFLYAERQAQQVRESAQEWFNAKSKQNFFVWMHFFDPHHPYLTHDPASTLAPYMQEVLYVDQQLSLFFEFLYQRNLLADTLVIITSDHGEAFGEHGEVSHSMFVYNTTLHVPLFISLPGTKPGRMNGIARLIDIYPTVVDVLKWPSSHETEGRSLAPALRGEPMTEVDTYAETLAPSLDFGWSSLFAIQSGKEKYIEAPKPEFYNLQTDPGENKNLIGQASVELHRKKIQDIIRKTRGPDATRPPMSQEEREKLESLGYVSSGNTQIHRSGIDPKDRIDVARKIAELPINNISPAEQAKAYQQLTSTTEAANPLLLLRYAEILLKLKRLREASEVFSRVEKLNYPSAAVYNGLASIYFQQEQMDKAEQVLNKAVARQIADGETFHNLAEIYLTTGRQEKAFHSYDQSIQFHFLPAYYRKAQLLEVLMKTEEAVQLLAGAKNIDPTSGRPDYETGVIYYKHQRFTDAIQEFESALKKEPESKWMLFNIGVVYQRLGNKQKSAEALRAFLRDGPADMQAERAEAQRLLNQ